MKVIQIAVSAEALYALCDDGTIWENPFIDDRDVLWSRLAAPAYASDGKVAVSGKAYNQHPMYERWKNICPQCGSEHTTHANERAEEFAVVLKCTDCQNLFSLKEAFDAQLAKEGRAGFLRLHGLIQD